MIEAVEQLFEQQMASWPLLARGVEAGTNALMRSVDLNGYDTFVRHIPHRIVSTTAAVDRASIEKRPCLLCASNLPPEEKGLALDSEFTAYCNPFPILDGHLTIVHREHRPQRIHTHIDSTLRFAHDLPGFFLIYNGPDCGASAPDHLHFQACRRTLFPIEHDLKKAAGGTIPNYARNVLVIQDADRERLRTRLESAIRILNDIAPHETEPLLNLAVFFESSMWTVLLFPRGKHRPAVFYSGELTVSPATIDLCGIVVAPLLQDYEDISAEQIHAVFEEVTLNDHAFRLFMEMLKKE